MSQLRLRLGCAIFSDLIHNNAVVTIITAGEQQGEWGTSDGPPDVSGYVGVV